MNAYNSSMNPVILVSHLSKDFKDLKAVNDISFTVNEGDVYGFLGQNGAGKSTTIRMLLTLIKPTNGSIEFFGKQLETHRKEILQNVGAVIERPDLYKYLDGYENLKIFAQMSGKPVSKEQINKTLDLVGLSTRANSKVKTYSQGMKQRLGIAIALVHDPKLIILDEPTNGLDPQGIADIRQLITHLSKDLNKTIVISSHLLYEIEQIANRCLIIHHGKKMSEGSLDDFNDPSKAVVEVTTTNDAMHRVAIEQSAWGQFLQAETKDRLMFNIARKDIPDLNAALVQMQIPIVEFGQRNSLERYFLSLTSNRLVNA